MPRFLLKLALLITLVLTATSLAARSLGSIQPPNPALRGFTEGCEGKPQPCWYGIVPGVTTIERAQQLLYTKAYKLDESTPTSFSFSNLSKGTSKTDTCSNIVLSYDRKALTVKSIVLNGCAGIVLGDLTFIGCPKTVGQLGAKAHEYILAEITQRVRLDKHKYHIWTPNIRLDSLAIGNNLDSVVRHWQGIEISWGYCLPKLD